MNQILKRDEYINEIYNPMIEQKKEDEKYQELVAINEGILKNLFGKIKNLFKQEWGKIKGNKEIIKVYKELDDSLTGFSTMKLNKKDDCNQIRQALVDFATDWYNLKLNAAKKAEREPKMAKSLNFKDETLKSNLEALQNKIKTIANGDQLMEKWANLLLNDMKVVINRSILAQNDAEIDEKERQELQKKQEEEEKKRKAEEEKINKQVEEWQNGQLTELDKERAKLISDVEATPMDENILGGKAVKNIYDEFSNINEDDKIADKIETFRKNTPLLALKHIFADYYDAEKDNNDSMDDYIKVSYELMKEFYEQLNKDMDLFKEVPGGSVQAMCISINAVIKNCIFGDPDYSDALPLMAKCAVISDGLVSYNLPLNGKTGNDAGNYFTDALVSIMNAAKEKGSDLDIPKDFNTNAKNLFDKIKDEAKKLKEKADKDYQDASGKLDISKVEEKK